MLRFFSNIKQVMPALLWLARVMSSFSGWCICLGIILWNIVERYHQAISSRFPLPRSRFFFHFDIDLTICISIESSKWIFIHNGHRRKGVVTGAFRSLIFSVFSAFSLLDKVTPLKSLNISDISTLQIAIFMF